MGPLFSRGSSTYKLSSRSRHITRDRGLFANTFTPQPSSTCSTHIDSCLLFSRVSDWVFFLLSVLKSFSFFFNWSVIFWLLRLSFSYLTVWPFGTFDRFVSTRLSCFHGIAIIAPMHRMRRAEYSCTMQIPTTQQHQTLETKQQINTAAEDRREDGRNVEVNKESWRWKVETPREEKIIIHRIAET